MPEGGGKEEATNRRGRARVGCRGMQGVSPEFYTALDYSAHEYEAPLFFCEVASSSEPTMTAQIAAPARTGQTVELCPFAASLQSHSALAAMPKERYGELLRNRRCRGRSKTYLAASSCRRPFVGCMAAILLPYKSTRRRISRKATKRDPR